MQQKSLKANSIEMLPYSPSHNEYQTNSKPGISFLDQTIKRNSLANGLESTRGSIGNYQLFNTESTPTKNQKIPGVKLKDFQCSMCN